MRKFPNTIFRIAGYFQITGEALGLAIVILESIENEERYFTQQVEDGKIVGLAETDVAFVPFDDQKHTIVRIGDQPVYCLISPSELGKRAISAVEVQFGQGEQFKELVRQKVAAGELVGEPLLEAAFFLGDSNVLLPILDRQYFKISKAQPKSAEFFRQNNILREMVIMQVGSRRLKDFARRTHIDYQEDAGRIEVTFPSSATLLEREELGRVFELEMKKSKSFSDPGTLIAFEEQPYADRLSLTDYAGLLRFDFPFNREFIEASSAREIFIPTAVMGRGIESVLGAESRESLISPYDFWQLVQVALGGSDPEPSLIGMLAHAREKRALNLEDATRIASATMMVARDLGVREWRVFGRIRCCTFAIRRWGHSSLEESSHAKLFSIATIHSKFEQARPNFAFLDFIRVAGKGVVGSENFGEVAFGLRSELTQFAVLAMHRPALDGKRAS